MLQKEGVWITLYNKAIEEKEKLKQEIKLLQKQLKGFPKGQLICSKNGKYYKWYNNSDGVYKYIPKKNKKVAEQLAVKKYLKEKLEFAQAEENAINKYLKLHKENASENLITKPGFVDLLKTYYQPISQELDEWVKADYERNPSYKDKLVHKTSSGNMVRSKSEVIIDMALYTNKIPFRYECALNLGHTIIYPDFTIRHPMTGDLFYWEHFGMMDDPNYYKNAYSKLLLYTSEGMVPGVNLITTFETKEKSQTSNLTLHLKELGKEEPKTPQSY